MRVCKNQMIEELGREKRKEWAKTMGEYGEDDVVLKRISSSSSKVVPLPETDHHPTTAAAEKISGDFGRIHDHHDLENRETVIINMQELLQMENSGSGTGGVGSGRLKQADDLLPITESRTGNTFTVAFHLLCSGIGVQALILPVAFVSLGWYV